MSSPERTNIDPSPSNEKPQSKRKRGARSHPRTSSQPDTPQLHSTATTGHIQPQSVPLRTVTPPLAMGESYPNKNHSSRVSPDQIRSSELSFTERNLVIMAIQEQTDWNAVADASGVGVDKLMKWWMRASSEIARRG